MFKSTCVLLAALSVAFVLSAKPRDSHNHKPKSPSSSVVRSYDSIHRTSYNSYTPQVHQETERDHLIDALKGYAEKLTADKPKDFDHLATIKNIEVDKDIQEVTVDDIDSVLQRWHLPSEVNDFLK
jgi:hypothetical protein